MYDPPLTAEGEADLLREEISAARNEMAAMEARLAELEKERED